MTIETSDYDSREADYILREAISNLKGKIDFLFFGGFEDLDEDEGSYFFKQLRKTTDELYSLLNSNIIEKANFITDGCGATVAAGSQTTLMIEGKPLQYAENLKPIDLDKKLGGLPDDHKHCAELAIRTLQRAIEKYKTHSNI